MPRPDKIETVAEFKGRIQNNMVAIATGYVGINVEQATELRSKLRGEAVTLKVYKNTLVRRALDELELSDAAEFLDGPTAWAFSNNPVAPAKVLKEYAKGVRFVSMNGGIFEGKVVTKEQLESLADLPPREMLLAQVVWAVAGPLRMFVGTLNALPRNLVNVLDQVRKQKEEAAAA